ncbi:TSUP family transporter [Paracoccus sp. S-4012]|uniref:sulfite exporter TauE/SafE family protein n=1 Tax=Paracoccus sp. S-4012 TaxID=2665648 RepID=UPI0012B06A25|nr:sulfite exporter TauE/SafE family protein [Paracoccus sp. S-4012]MRX50562.1 TSUP family transporter [Paracoccus sp. S-4012]
MTPEAWALSVVAAVAVGMAKGGLSMVGMLGVPVMALVMSPVQAAGILLPVYIVSDMGGLIAYRRRFDRRVLATALPGALAGIGLGWATASIVPEAFVTGLVGLIGAVFALNALTRPAGRTLRQPHPGRGSFWGLLAGFTSFVSHSGAPPWQVYIQPLGLAPLTFAGTSTVFFAVVNAAKLPPYWALGQLSAGNLRVSAVLVPLAFASVWIGVRLVRIMPMAVFYRFITWTLLLVSLRLLWDALT